MTPIHPASLVELYTNLYCTGLCPCYWFIQLLTARITVWYNTHSYFRIVFNNFLHQFLATCANTSVNRHIYRAVVNVVARYQHILLRACTVTNYNAFSPVQCIQAGNVCCGLHSIPSSWEARDAGQEGSTFQCILAHPRTNFAGR